MYTDAIEKSLFYAKYHVSGEVHVWDSEMELLQRANIPRNARYCNSYAFRNENSQILHFYCA